MKREKSLAVLKRGLFAQIIRGIRKTRSFFPVYGVRGTLKMALHDTLSMERVYRMEKRLDRGEYQLETKIPITIRTMSGELSLTKAEADKVRGIRGDYGIEQFEERLARGDIMFGAYHEEQLTGFVWLEYPPVRTAGCKVPDDMAFTYDAWTFEEFRGNRIFPAIQQAIFHHLREHNPEVKRVLTQVATWNKASAYADQSAGYIIVGLEWSVIVLGYNFRLKIV